MRIRFWGVRGSIPVPGQSTLIYGGNTPCLDILTAAGQLLIIDAGTGIRRLGQALQQKNPRRVDVKIFLSHTHWDHIQGLPFFAPLANRRNKVHVYGRKRIGKHLEEILAGQFIEPYLPFAYRSLEATMRVQEVEAGEIITLGEGTTIAVADLNHPGGALGFRIEDHGQVFAYCCDTGHDLNSINQDIVALASGADLLVHDAHFSSRELSRKYSDWGHSSWHDAATIAHLAEVKVLGLFHYAPDMDDEQVEHIAKEARAYFPRTIMTREGMILKLPLSEELPN